MNAADLQQGADECNERGLALARAGRANEALAAFEQAVRLCPDHAWAVHHCGLSLLQLGRSAEAEAAFHRAIRLAPTEPDFHCHLAHLLRQLGRTAAAETSYARALHCAPNRADLHRAYGALLFDLGRSGHAIVAYRRALALAPDAETHNDLGNAYRRLEKLDEAAACYRRALEANPGLAPAHANLANLCAEEGRTEEARHQYQQAHRYQPSARLRLLYETLLPVLYDSMEHLHESRQRFRDGVLSMNNDGLRIDPTQELFPTHFYLAYHGLNDRHLCAALARLGQGPRRLDFHPAPAVRGKKIRIGFLSRYLRQHTIGQLNHRLIAGLSRDRFEVTILSIGQPDEGLGQRIQQSADRYIVLPSDIGAALRLTAGLGLDVLYYPDLGMDSQSWTMAFSRLAPIQCVGWGHPVTTGLPTIDYFLSTQDEIAVADEHYTEQLVRLPRLSVVYDRPQLTGPVLDRTSFGLSERAHLYACPQSLFKFHPEFDRLLGDILRQDPAGHLVLVEGKYPHWTELLRRRFARTIPDVQDRIQFLPHQSRDRFLHLLTLADVMLDPIHFGGGNTGYEGLALGVPIVTLPPEFLRGRLAFAQYRQMGLLDLVARDGADYVRLAVRLGTEPDYRHAMRRRIREAAGVLYDDVGVIRHLEDFLTEAVEKKSVRE